MNPLRRRSAAALACLASVAIGACVGGDDGSSDEDEIREVIERAFATRDPANCGEVTTDAFLEKFYDGSVQACRMDVERGQVAESVEVETIEIDGDEASADATPAGGDSSGQTLAVRLVKDGDEWLIDDAIFGADQVAELFFRGVREDALGRGLDRKAADCIVRSLRRTVTPQELDALRSGERPAGLAQKAEVAGRICR